MAENILHPVAEIKGIGQATATKLQKKGLYYSEQLLLLSPEDLFDWLKPAKGITIANLSTKLIPQARLLCVDGMNGQYAEGLVASGIKSYRDLVTSNAKTIYTLLEKKPPNGKKPELEEIISWQLSAARLIGTGLLFVTVIDESTRKRLPGVTVGISGLDPLIKAPVRLKTNDRGVGLLAGLLPARHTLELTAKGYLSFIAPFDIEASGGINLLIELKKGKHRPRVIDEFKGGIIDVIDQSATFKTKRVSLADLPKKPPAHVVEIEEKEVLLSSLWRRQTDNVIEVLTFMIKKSELPRKINKNSVLLPDKTGKYRISELSIIEFRRKNKIERFFEMRKGGQK